MWEDAIIEEVRNIGEAIVKECENDVHKYFLQSKKGIEVLKKTGWKVIGKDKLDTINTKALLDKVELK